MLLSVRLGLQRRARLALHQINFVPDLDHRGRLCHTERGQDLCDILRLLAAFRMRDIAHMQNQIGVQHLLQRRAERRDQFGRQIADEPHRVRQDHFRPVRQLYRAHRRIQRGEQHVLRHHLCPCEPVENRRLARVRIAHQGHHRIRHFRPRSPVQRPCFDDLR